MTPDRLASAQDDVDALARAAQAQVARQVLETPDQRAGVLAAVLWGRGNTVTAARALAAGLVDALARGRAPRLASPATADRLDLERRLDAYRQRGDELRELDGRWLRQLDDGRWVPVPTARDLVQDRLNRADLTARARALVFATTIGVTSDALENPRVRDYWARQVAVAAGRIAHDAAVDAWRDSTFDRLTERDARGWARLAERTACGACLALADGTVHPPTDRRFYRHTRCQCVPVAVFADGPQVPTGRQLFNAMTAEEQDRAFRGHGGRAKAQALRDGTIELQDLVTIADERLERTDYVVTETPLRDLVPA